MDCCSKIDFAHFRTSSKVSSSLGSNLVHKSINFGQNLDPKGTSQTGFIFLCRFSLQSLPKGGPKGTKSAWSELRTSALGPIWRQSIAKTLSQAPKLLILTSSWPYWDLIFDLFRLLRHHFQLRFPLQSSTHNSFQDSMFAPCRSDISAQWSLPVHRRSCPHDTLMIARVDKTFYIASVRRRGVAALCLANHSHSWNNDAGKPTER